MKDITVTVKSLVKCGWCKGNGVGESHYCSDCEGTGYRGGMKAVEEFEFELNRRLKEVIGDDNR